MRPRHIAMSWSWLTRATMLILLPLIHSDTHEFSGFIMPTWCMLVPECSITSHLSWSSCGSGGIALSTPFEQDGAHENWTRFNLYLWLKTMPLVFWTLQT